MKTPGEINTAGVVKYVYDDFSEEEMKNDISHRYPGAECEFFKRKTDDKFMGMIKVDFKNRTTLLDVIQNKIKFCDQRYIVEEYKRKSRVIKCANCQ